MIGTYTDGIVLHKPCYVAPDLSAYKTKAVIRDFYLFHTPISSLWTVCLTVRKRRSSI